MSKVTKEQKESVSEEPAKVEPALIPVEMTKAQADDFARWCLEEEKRKAEAVEAAKPEQMFQMHLFARHNINGVGYGPGMVTVPSSISGTIAHADFCVRKNEMNLNVGNKKLFEVMMNGQVVPRPVGR